MPFKGYKTYYRVVGEKTDRAPLVLLHGGPGSTHNYFEVLDPLAELTHRQIISYDQIGCGESYLDGHPELWNLDTWMEELSCLLDYLKVDRYHLLGQSWGGKLAIAHAIEKKPKGLCSLILSSTLPESQLWGKEQHRLISYMSPKDQKAIAEAEATGNFQSKGYLLANEHFVARHEFVITPDTPECMSRKKRFGDEAYLVGWGPNEYNPTGTLRDFNYTDRLHEISCPTLVVSGTDDLCTPYIAKTMFDRIPHASWQLFYGARHMVFTEQTQTYLKMMEDWMKE
jgi:proline iminopeptidase